MEFALKVSDYDFVVMPGYGKSGLKYIGEMIRLARVVSKPALIDPKDDACSKYTDAALFPPFASYSRR